LANNTEIVAFLSSGVSFTRFLRPYLIGATVVAFLSIILGLFLAPKASEGFNYFNYEYFKKGRSAVDNDYIFRQINDNDIIYVSSFNVKNNLGHNFTLEHFEENQLKYKITARTIKYVENDTIYKLTDYLKRDIGKNEDSLEIIPKKDTLFAFNVKDLTPPIYAAEVLMYGDLKRFIAEEEARGSSNVGRFKLVLYRKWSLPVSVFILTIIAVAVSSIKRRGGMGVNLAVGICIAMIFVFFDKVFGVMAEQSDFPPLVAVWFPNFIFGILAIYLLYNAKR
jgi:lipopolysaccharide export system permease protein